MKITNLRNNETLAPKCTLHFTEDDAKRLRKLLKKAPNRELLVELPEITQLLGELDTALIKLNGREVWEKSIRAGMAPKTEVKK